MCHSPLFVTFFFRKCFICSSGVLGCQGYVCFCSSICIKVPSKPIFIFTLMAGVRTIIKGRKCQYLGSWATNHKTNDTLLSQTLKVEEKKVSLVFLFVAQEPRYWHFCNLTISRTLLPKFQKIKWAPGPQIKKLMTLSFLQLLKFEKSKYPYFFNLWLRGRDICLFSLDDCTFSSS